MRHRGDGRRRRRAGARSPGHGNGPIEAFTRGLRDATGADVRVVDYHEHALGEGADATAVAYVEIAVGNGAHAFGVGRDPNLITASLRAVLGAVRRGQQTHGRIVAASSRVAVVTSRRPYDPAADAGARNATRSTPAS